MASETDIANLAAVKIGSETRITSLDDNRPLARTLSAVWDIERRATLRDGSFNFSARRGALAQIDIADKTTIYPYSAAFELPTDALRLIEVLNPEVRDSYQLEGRQILADTTGPLYARWIIDVEEPASWDDAFAEAFACRLAWRCGKKVIGGNFDSNGAWQEYQAAIGAAKGVDAKENPPIEQEESDWVLARFRSAGSI
jgi:hypothetical protein